MKHFVKQHLLPWLDQFNRQARLEGICDKNDGTAPDTIEEYIWYVGIPVGPESTHWIPLHNPETTRWLMLLSYLSTDSYGGHLIKEGKDGYNTQEENGAQS